MKIATWNVNGIRARQSQVQDWMEREQPDVVCLQEIKASIDQLPVWLCEMEGYWCYWHGGKGYSGVGAARQQADRAGTSALRASRIRLREPHRARAAPEHHRPRSTCRTAAKTFPRRCGSWPRWSSSWPDCTAPNTVVICGDLNIARTDMDVHPKERKPRAIGQLPEERAQLERIIEPRAGRRQPRARA